jgi:hypothetical protein
MSVVDGKSDAMRSGGFLGRGLPAAMLVGLLVVMLSCWCRMLLDNVGLGTKYVFLHVGWVQNLNLFFFY